MLLIVSSKLLVAVVTPLLNVESVVPLSLRKRASAVSKLLLLVARSALKKSSGPPRPKAALSSSNKLSSAL